MAGWTVETTWLNELIRAAENPTPKAGRQSAIMNLSRRARAIGINHVALEFGDIDEALEFYGQFLEFELGSKGEDMAFIDLD